MGLGDVIELGEGERVAVGERDEDLVVDGVGASGGPGTVRQQSRTAGELRNEQGEGEEATSIRSFPSTRTTPLSWRYAASLNMARSELRGDQANLYPRGLSAHSGAGIAPQ